MQFLFAKKITTDLFIFNPVYNLYDCFFFYKIERAVQQKLMTNICVKKLKWIVIVVVDPCESCARTHH